MTAPWQLAKRTLIAFILFWGVLGVLARLGTPLLEHARAPIADWLGEQAGLDIRIGRLSAAWYGLGPRLRLHQVSIGDVGRPLLLREIALDVSPSALFGDTPLDALRLTLRGLELHLRREANGQVHLVGLPLPEAKPDNRAQALVLPGRLRLRETRLHFHDMRVNAPPLTIDNLFLDLHRDGPSLRLRAQLDSALGQMHFAADAQGSLQQTDWSGSSYLRIRGMHLAKLFGAYLPRHYRLADGRLDLELWQQWQDALPMDSRGKMALHDASLASAEGPAHQADFKQIRSEFQFDRIDGQQWQLQLERLVIGALPPGKVAARRTTDSGQATIDAAIEHLAVEDLRNLLLIRAPSAYTEQALNELQPRGRIQNIRFTLPPDGNAWGLSADFEALAIDPWQKIPGLHNLGGQFAATAQHSSLTLNTREAPLDYRSLFREPMHISRLQGDLHLARQPQGWTLLSEELQLDTPDLSSRTRLALSIPQEKTPHLDLISELRDGSVSAAGKYLPAGIMSPYLVGWLDSALSEGRLEQATALLSGPLDSFPYQAQRNGTFEVEALVHGARLHYRDSWPALKDLSAHLRFAQNSMDLTLLEGRIRNSRVRQLRARIARLWPSSPLHITGRIDGPLQDQVEVLKDGALSKDFGHIAKALTVGGNSELVLDFEVPLSDIGRPRLDGALLFRNAQMSLPEWNLQIDQINGELAIGLDEIRATSLSGKTLGAPVRVKVGPLADQRTRINAQIHLPGETLAQRLPQVPMHLADGSTDFSINLDIPGVSARPDAPTWLTVNSDLQGMRIDLPEPFGKTAAQTRRMEIRLDLSDTPRATRISYDDKLSAAIGPDWENADIRYQRGQAASDPANGYQFKAGFDQLDLSAWQAVFNRLESTKTRKTPDWTAQIAAQKLGFDSLTLQQAKLGLRGGPQGITGQVTSDRLAGDFDYRRKANGVLKVNLQKLHMDFDADAQGSPRPPEPAHTPDPRSLPAMQISCDDLRLNQAQFGTGQLLTEVSPLGMRIQRLDLEGPAGRLQASGAWNWRNKIQHTELSGSVETPDLGALLLKLGYPRHMHEAGAKAAFNLEWPGHPGQAHKASLGGALKLQIGAGRLANLDPGVMRVIGLLSVDALTRRLKLNFADLVKEGYSFDTIEGNFRLDEGSAYTKDLIVDGPSSRIVIGGRIGLVDRDFDQLVSVTPKLDATVTIASTLAGGPVAGIAALLAQELLAKEVDQINRFEYSVKGGWDKPELTALDSGGGLSRLVNTLTGKKTESRTLQQDEMIDRSESENRGPLKRLLKKLPGGSEQSTEPSPQAPAGD